MGENFNIFIGLGCVFSLAIVANPVFVIPGGILLCAGTVQAILKLKQGTVAMARLAELERQLARIDSKEVNIDALQQQVAALERKFAGVSMVRK